MHDSVMTWFLHTIQPQEVQGKRVLEVGSRNVNGSVRPLFERYKPAHYLGVDIENGPGVDLILNATNLEVAFGADSWDVVVASETLEHVENWVTSLRNMLAVLRPGGLLCITTRSPGFPYHPYPEDNWRYTVDDFLHFARLADLTVADCLRDPEQPGVFFKAWKPTGGIPWDGLPPEPYLSQIPVIPMKP